MARRLSRVPVTKSTESFAVPICSVCRSKMRKNDVGEWFCLKCADEWLATFVENKVGAKSLGGVHLPSGVKDERRVRPSFSDIHPNRAARRAARRSK